MSRKYKLGLLIAAAFFFLNIPLISEYGLNWDEPTHYLRGQAFIRFFLTGKTDYTELPTIQTHIPKSAFFMGKKQADFKDDTSFRRSLYQTDGRGGDMNTFRYFVNRPTGHPPINGELASLSNLVFYQFLGILGDIESYRLFTLFASALLIFIVFVFTAEVWGGFAAMVAVIALVSYPLFFAESHFNIKDPVSASFYTVTLYTFYKAITTKRFIWIIVSSIACGFALGTKLNVFFLPLTLLPWLVMLIVKRKIFSSKDHRFVLAGIACYAIVPFAILIACYPALWKNPLEGFMTTLSTYKDLGFATQYQLPEYFIFGFFNTYPLKWLLFTTPPITLLLSIVGILYILLKSFREKYYASLLIFLWFLIPILRVTIGGISIYGGLRQIMEYIPAMAILAGIGADYIVQNLKFKMQNYSAIWRTKFKIFNHKLQLLTFIFELLIILSFIPITLKLISIHPNQNVYFNTLMGGLNGAKEKNLQDWGVTLGSVYQQGINWLNKNAEQDANLALVRGLHSNIPRIKLRQDINFDNRYYSGEAKKGEYIMEVIDYNWSLFIDEEKRNYLETLRLVYEVNVDSVSILKIWKNNFKYSQP